MNYNQGLPIMVPMMNLSLMAGLSMTPTDPKVFRFVGNVPSLHARIQSMTDEEVNRIIEVDITLYGKQVKQNNSTCFWCTIIWGSIVLFPLCFICCKWWKKVVGPAYEIQNDTYQGLSQLLRGHNVNNLVLNVVDNTFDAQKAQILYKIVRQNKLKGLTLVNSAGPYGFKHDEYQNFMKNVQSLRGIQSLMTDIRWNSGSNFYSYRRLNYD